MKKILFAVVAMSTLLVSCGTKNEKSNEASATKTEQTEEIKKYTVEQLLEAGATIADEKVTVVATINHTCKFSGRRAFVVGKDPNVTLRVEAKGDIGGFNRELVGSEVAITGIFKENRLTKEYIDKWEEEVKEAQGKEDGSAESCHSETNNINAMRAWMKKNNKEYYSLFYMDGLSYEVVE